jgi:hypothetical protein
MAAATAVAVKASPGFVVISGTCTLDPGSILTEANEDQTIAVAEAKVGDMVLVSPRAALLDGVAVVNPHVDTAGSITFTLENNAGVTRDVATGTWDWMLVRGQSGIATAG